MSMDDQQQAPIIDPNSGATYMNVGSGGERFWGATPYLQGINQVQPGDPGSQPSPSGSAAMAPFFGDRMPVLPPMELAHRGQGQAPTIPPEVAAMAATQMQDRLGFSPDQIGMPGWPPGMSNPNPGMGDLWQQWLMGRHYGFMQP